MSTIANSIVTDFLKKLQNSEQSSNTMIFEKFLLGERSISEIEYADVEAFFKVRQDESLRLEFKSFDDSDYKKSKLKLPEKIINTLCAFSNSEGGILIYGSPQELEDEEQNSKYAQGKLVPLPVSVDYDSLCRQVKSSLFPQIDTIQIRKIENNNGSIFIFDVKPATVPVMAKDKVFYVRINSETAKAEYYLVDALFKRRSTANLELKAYISTPEDTFQLKGPFRDNQVSLQLNLTLKNTVPYKSSVEPFIQLKLTSYIGKRISWAHTNIQEIDERFFAGNVFKKYPLKYLNYGDLYSFKKVFICEVPNSEDYEEYETEITTGGIDTAIKVSQIFLRILRRVSKLEIFDLTYDTERTSYDRVIL